MVFQLPPTQTPAQTTDIVYPESDGRRMAENTEQFRWIVTIKENLELLFADNPTVFVAGDLLWYPVEGNPKICTAPDGMVAVGRPKGRRGSYQQWREDGIAPQVVFEVLSPSNDKTEMARKLLFYDRYNVEEYYVYDPDTNGLEGWLRTEDDYLDAIADLNHWVSPRLGIRFEIDRQPLEIFRPDGQKFLTYVELGQRLEQERQRANELEEQLRKYRERFGDLPE